MNIHTVKKRSYILECIPLQARSQKIMVGGSFEGNVDLFLWSHSANHSPGAVDELIFYDVCNPTFIRANCSYIQNI